ncbi:speckle-type POZ protein-like [Trichogramma pretiosum]|uniref:speckle-type POZ protein-like n=1 Tax=Trichogramma pretiosum TaxID=7493 RepID=UPI0006C9871B|nr:speckle-type POZ protein-like [Trichogramma pretiosum]
MGNHHGRYTSDSSFEEPYDPFRDSEDNSEEDRDRPPPEPKIESYNQPSLTYQKGEADGRDVEIHRASYTQTNYVLKSRSHWTISQFGYSDVVKKENGSIRSDVISIGGENQFQYFFVMDKIELKDDIHYGLYINVLSNIRSEATYKIRSFIRNHKAHKVGLTSSRHTKFPRKNGYKFLGSMDHSTLYEEDSDYSEGGYFSLSLVPEGDMTLLFKIEVSFNSRITNELRSLVEKNKNENVTLVVGKKEFKANEKIIQERCPKLAEMITKKKKGKSPITGVDPEIMEQIMQYIYTNRVTKLFTHGRELEKAAKKFGLKDLQQMCKKANACSAVSYKED